MTVLVKYNISAITHEICYCMSLPKLLLVCDYVSYPLVGHAIRVSDLLYRPPTHQILLSAFQYHLIGKFDLQRYF